MGLGNSSANQAASRNIGVPRKKIQIASAFASEYGIRFTVRFSCISTTEMNGSCSRVFLHYCLSPLHFKVCTLNNFPTRLCPTDQLSSPLKTNGCQNLLEAATSICLLFPAPSDNIQNDNVHLANTATTRPVKRQHAIQKQGEAHGCFAAWTPSTPRTLESQ